MHDNFSTAELMADIYAIFVCRFDWRGAASIPSDVNVQVSKNFSHLLISLRHIAVDPQIH